jgi:hypothetical protein
MEYVPKPELWNEHKKMKNLTFDTLKINFQSYFRMNKKDCFRSAANHSLFKEDKTSSVEGISFME